MTVAPAVLVTGAVGVSAMVASATHDLAVQWVSAIVIAGTLGGFAWMRRAIRRQQREDMLDLLEELGVIDRPHARRQQTRRKP